MIKPDTTFKTPRKTYRGKEILQLRNAYFSYVASIVATENITKLYSVQNGETRHNYAVYAQGLPDNRILVMIDARALVVADGFDQQGNPYEIGVRYAGAITKHDNPKVDAMNKMIKFASKSVLALDPEQYYRSDAEKQASLKMKKDRERSRQENPRYRTITTPRREYLFEDRKELKKQYRNYVNILVQSGNYQSMHQAVNAEGKTETYVVLGGLPDNRGLVITKGELHVIDGFDNQGVAYKTGIYYAPRVIRGEGTPEANFDNDMVARAKVIAKQAKQEIKQQGVSGWS